ncbi:hypothetical protein GF406_13510 [candidate division KSB1 bacterium]|nr:hypothetical protein [candidate division KSB1 bacterium]
MPCLPSNPERLYVAGKNATLMLSRDGGLNWETVKNSADNQYVGLYANSEGHVMATGYTFHSGWWDDAPAGTQFSLHMMGTHFGAMWNERTGGRTDSSRLTASGMVYDSGADLDVYVRTKSNGIIQYSESVSAGFRVWKNGFVSEDSRIAFYDIEMRLNYGWAVGSFPFDVGTAPALCPMFFAFLHMPV